MIFDFVRGGRVENPVVRFRSIGASEPEDPLLTET